MYNEYNLFEYSRMRQTNQHYEINNKQFSDLSKWKTNIM